MAEHHISLRGRTSDAQFMAACEAVLGSSPPTEPNTVSSNIFWLGPDEWLVVGRDAGVMARLRDALQGVHSAVVDVTSSRVLLEIPGPHAEATLSSACTLDFHPRSFPVGSCAQTNVARTQGLIYRRAEDEFVIFVRPSFERYLRQWLAAAKATFRAPDRSPRR